MVSREEVLKIAKLARLELTEKEVELYQVRLGRVLDYIKEISALDVSEAGFVRHVPKDSVAFREDRALPFANARALMENAPASEDNQFLLPKIVEHS
jgi:aspartyl-tRNA(Asn)/glutamyl-tRNA(Gln) amidotransferase subunit C